MNRKMATYLRFGPVVALLAILGVAFALLPVGPASAALTGISMTINPDAAGTVAEYRIAFTTSGALLSNTGEIVLTFDKDIGFPTSISRSNVFLTASAVTNGGVAGQSVNPPADPVISLDTADSRRKTVTMKVPDMDPGTTAGTSALINDIAATAAVTVTFSQGSGLTNPTAAEITASGIGRTQIFVLTRSGGVTDPAGGAPGTAPTGSSAAGFADVTPIPRSITLNRVDGARNQAVTVSGRGYTVGNTATVFLDSTTAGTLGVYDVGIDVDLVQVTVGADSTFTTTISMDSRFASGANAIRATDGTTEAAPGTINVNTVARSLRLRGKVSVTPTEARRGDAITVTLEDFVAGAAIVELNIGGATMIGAGAGQLAANTAFPASLRLSANVNVPALTPLGVQEIKAGTAADDGRSVKITIKGAPLTVSPGTAVPNQSITLSGTGYTTGGTAATTPCTVGGGRITIAAANGVTIGGVAIVLADPICVDNGGNWVVSPPLIVPVNVTNLTPGNYVVRATDSGGAVGEGTLIIPARTLALSPVSSRQRSTITVTGSGFPANNTQAGADNRTVTINYATPAGGAAAASVTATPDASGRFSVSMTVPTTAGIPSDNTVTATIPAGATAATATATIVHAVPSAAISVNPGKGLPGSSITLTGSNFPTFSTFAAAAITLGGRNVTASPIPSTDRDGSFSATGILVPDLDPGVHSVIVTVGGTTATASFEITTAPVAPPAPVPAVTVGPAAALTPLGANLVRVWGYDAPTQKFKLYDPAALILSDLAALNRGGGYWINVKAAQTATLGTASYSLSAGWNLVGWLG